MAIPREQLQKAVDAGHPDQALVGIPVSLLREMLRILPVEAVFIGLDMATGPDIVGRHVVRAKKA